MSEHLKSHFSKVLEKMERLEQQIIQKRGYCKDSRSHRMLIELIKEQLPNENIGHTTRTLR